jgi:hypothetical protein
MKPTFILLLLAMVATLSGCKKEDFELTSDPEVEEYIALLKANQYDLMGLPDFSHQQIPALLIYRNETQVITDFPHNGLSSLYGPDCKLGMYVLWTIESIRAVAIDSEFLSPGRFPSLNPILALRDADELEVVYDSESHEVAAKAYYDWWITNRDKDFDEFKNTDPLSETAYRWH